MAIETGAIFKKLYFDGQSSGNYGVYISGEGTFNAPKRDVEMVSIPGRNGDLALDKGRFENIEGTYKAGLFGVDEADFAEAISDFRNFLCSRKGYVRLEDDYNPDEYRMAVYKSGLEVDAKQLKAGEFDIVFDCKPQRWLKSGEEAVTIGEWGETETVTGEIVTIDAEDTDAVKSLSVALEPIQDLHGYDKPWSGGAGKNLLNVTADTQTIYGITYTVNRDESGNLVSIVANGTASNRSMLVLWLDYSDISDFGLNGRYVLTGCPTGGAGNSYSLALQARGSGNVTDTGGGGVVNTDSLTEQPYRFIIDIKSGTTVNNIVFKPMLRLASETDATYEPYSNICPISGRRGMNVYVAYNNFLDPSYRMADGTYNGVTFTSNSDGSVTISGTATSGTHFMLTEPTPTLEAENSLPAGNLTGQLLFIRCSGLTGNMKCNAGYFDSENPEICRLITDQSGLTPSEDNIISRLDNKAIALMMEIWIPSGETVNTTVYPRIGLQKSVTTDDYVPFRKNRYTTDLGQTVYGGTLDVVSGVLTVDRVCKTLTTARNLSGAYAGSIIYNRSSAETTDADFTKPFICNGLEYVGNQMSAFRFGTCINALGTSFNLWIKDGAFADLSEATAWLQANTTQICYYLAEPQTYTLTAQQVALLMGTNNVWSDSGEVTLEFGQNPNYLINPTLFESSPLLEVEGYGTIGFNEYSIEVNDDIFGYIHVSEPVEVAPSGYGSVNLYAGIDLNSELLNEGDSLDIDELSLGVTYRPAITIVGSPTVAITYSDGTPYDKDYEVITERVGSASSNRRRTRVIFKNIGSLAYFSGTGPEINLKVVITGSASSGAEWVTGYDLSFSTSSNRPVVNINAMITGGTNIAEQKLTTARISAVTGYSTVSVLGHPTYVDCEAGEGYRELGSGYMSLNRYIDLGSDLPKLAPGPNEVTHDDTITELKVLPRWWKV